MLIFKKLLFSIPFLISLAFFFGLINNYFTNPYNLISFDQSSFLFAIYLITALLFTGIFYTIFIGIAQDTKFILPIILVATLTPLAFNPGFSFYVIVQLTGLLTLLLFIYFLLTQSLKKYIDFSPTTLFSPSIKNFSRLMLIVISLSFFIFLNQFFKDTAFEVPDSLIDTALKTVPQSVTTQTDPSSVTIPSKIKLDPEQLEVLKQNPQALEQFGLSVSDLESLSKSLTVQTESEEQEVSLDQMLIKTAVKKQVNEMVKPYLQFAPIVFSILLFLSLTTLLSLFFLFISPILILIFYILEKSNFIHFEKEMREVKKLKI